MKAIILTSAPVTSEEAELLQNSNVVKLAINGLAEILKPTYRICSDYGILGDLLKNHPQKLITTRDYAQNDRLIYAGHIPFRGSTLTAAVEYLIKEGYKKILIVGDNTAHADFFQKRINDEIEKILAENECAEVFQYSKGNFNLPTISIKQFLGE